MNQEKKEFDHTQYKWVVGKDKTARIVNPYKANRQHPGIKTYSDFERNWNSCSPLSPNESYNDYCEELEAHEQYKDFEQFAAAHQFATNAEPGVYEGTDFKLIEQYRIYGIRNNYWTSDKSEYKGKGTRQFLEYIGEVKPKRYTTELEYIQRPKQEFMADQIANNIAPTGYTGKRLEMLKWAFELGFENGINWQKHN